jgi:hypothetical protein
VDSVWNRRADRLNQRLRDEGLPVLIANMDWR